nr:hypothetical protein A6C57_18060 [Fibrella sp. ES10-3-2-2]
MIGQLHCEQPVIPLISSKMPVDFFVLICDRLAEKNHAAGRFDRKRIDSLNDMAECAGLASKSVASYQ